MKKTSLFLLGLLTVCLCTVLFSCRMAQTEDPIENPTVSTQENNIPDETLLPLPEETIPPVTEEPVTAEPVVKDPIDISTIGGVVVVGRIGADDTGWYFEPEQPLNVAFSAFLEVDPFLFPETERISMFDPQNDGVEKANYVGRTVTVYGTFSFLRSDTETLYLLPYSIVVGKNVESSYAAPDLQPPEVSESLYDPTLPLPENMCPTVMDGQYVYNAFMLSAETLALMGNDFVPFYIDFVDAFLNYRTEIPCPDVQYAEMLGTIIYYEFPMYNACAEPFEFFKHYDRENKTVRIAYKYDETEHRNVIDTFLRSADDMLAGVTPEQSDVEKAKTIYHAICTRMTYDDSAMIEFEKKESHYAYLYNTGVCITFANVYNQLLNQVGIATELAHCSNTLTVGHTWSLITLDGEKYFCDPTYELSYDNGTGFRFFGMNYADRIADGAGVNGIRVGRYNVVPIDADVLADQSLQVQ